jgi:hypothetical protein
LVVAVEVAFDCEGSKVGEGINIGDSDTGIVLGEREVEACVLGTGTGFTSDGKVD